MPTEIQQKQENNTIFRSMGLVIRSVGDNANRFELSFSSEAPVYRWDGSAEILQHDTNSVDLARLQSSGCVLFAHGYDPVIGKMPIAKIFRVWLDETEKKCRAEIEFDEDDEKAMLIRNKTEKGMLSGVSVRGNVGAWMDLKPGEKSPDGRFSGPAHIAVKWTPYEFSLEPVPADSTVGVGRSADFKNMEGVINMGEEESLVRAQKATPQANGGAVPPVVSAVSTVPAAAPAAQPIVRNEATPLESQTETTRCADITDICRHFGGDAGQYIRSNFTVDQVRTEVMRNMMIKNPPLPASTHADVTIVHEELDKVCRAAVDGMLMRGGIAVAKPADGARDFQGMRLRDVAVETLIRSGMRDANRMSQDAIFRAVMTPDSAFGSIAAEVAHNAASTAYAAAMVTYPQWTAAGTFTDFRPTKIWQISAAEEPELIPQNGEFTHGQMGDQAMAMRQGVTYGKIFTLTRQAFYNDDIQLLTKMPAAYTTAARRLINRLVYRLLLDNPIMLDGRTLFCTEHGNLCGGAAPSVEAYSAARRLMRKQRDISGKQTLNIVPKFVLSSSLHETRHEQLLASIADPASNNANVVNPFNGKMQLIVDAELDVDSGLQPYFFAGAPGICDTIEVASLNGEDAPKVESRMAFSTLGMEYRIYDDKAITLVDHKALAKNQGV